jgi:TatD DNase family protein
MIKYVDIHSHLNFPQFGADMEGVLKRMEEKEVATITVGTSIQSSKAAIMLAEANKNVYASVGIHPDAILSPENNNLLFDEKEFEGLLGNSKIVAIGECGLDYGRDGGIDNDAKNNQKKVFESQIIIAIKNDKPLMIHARNSTKDTLEILRSYKKSSPNLYGNAHFFTGTVEEAKSYFDLGFTISFTGVITFTQDHDDVIKFAPLDLIMSETDSPYVAPVPFRGKRNEPSYVVEVVKRIAEIKAIEETKMIEILKNNAVAKFKLLC